jgi:hypothetical protein
MIRLTITVTLPVWDNAISLFYWNNYLQAVYSNAKIKVTDTLILENGGKKYIFHRNSQILKNEFYSGAPEGVLVPAPLVTPIYIFDTLLHILFVISFEPYLYSYVYTVTFLLLRQKFTNFKKWVLIFFSVTKNI